MPTTKYWTGSQWVPIPGPPTGQVWTQPIGDGVNTVFQAWHGLGTRNVIVAVYRNSAPYDEVVCDIERTDANTVTVRTLPYIPTASEFILVVASGGAQATLNIAMDQWHNVGNAGEPAFQNGWVNYSGTIGQQARFRKYPDGKVRLAGIIKTGASGTIAFTLPVGYRPTASEVFFILAWTGTATLTIAADGTVTLANRDGAVATQAIIDGIEFDTEAVTQVASIGAQPMDGWHYVGNPGEPAFQNSFSDWDGAAPTGRAARFRKYPDGRVRLEGIVRCPVATGTIFTLPVGYRPAANTELYWPVVANAALTYVNVGSGNGNVVVTGATVNGWLDLSSIEFDTGLMGYVTGSFPYLPVTMDTWHVLNAAGEPALQNGWIPASGDSPPSFRKYPDGQVRIKGLLTKSSGNFTANELIFTMPVGYRPPYAVRATCRASGATGGEVANRIDVYADGTVKLVSGGNANPVAYATLDEITYDVEDVRQVASSAAQPMDSWHLVGNAGEPTFQSSWVNYGGVEESAGYRKYPDGRVRLKGTIKSGSVGPIFTLPAGYRPPTNRYISIYTQAGYGSITITGPGGVVTANQTGGTYTSLEGIEFDTETQSSYPSAFVQINAPPRVTSLPVSPAPVDGQEVYLVVDAANQIIWHLRYNASGSNKWEFLGGQPLYAFIASPSAPAVTGGWTSPADWPAIPLPIAGIAGDWLVETGGRITNNNVRSTPNFACFMTGFGTALINGLTTYNPQVGLETASMRGKTGVVPSAAWPLRLGYAIYGGTPTLADVTYDNLWISVLPVRVG